LKKPLLVALAGNPNAGKSTLFNTLTGGRQRVGNWPGKTVEKKTGAVRANGYRIDLVDLPGTYSLTAFSAEEEIARDFLIHNAPDAVIIVADAAHLERHLYLAVQVLELGLPAVLALNMSDIAEGQGLRIDRQRLGRMLGVPVVCTVASAQQGLTGLLDSVANVVGEGAA